MCILFYFISRTHVDSDKRPLLSFAHIVSTAASRLVFLSESENLDTLYPFCLSRRSPESSPRAFTSPLVRCVQVKDRAERHLQRQDASLSTVEHADDAELKESIEVSLKTARTNDLGDRRVTQHAQLVFPTSTSSFCRKMVPSDYIVAWTKIGKSRQHPSLRPFVL